MGRKKNNTSELSAEKKQLTPLAQRLSELITDTNSLKDYLNCSIQAINQYKQGTSQPSLDNLQKIADFYDVSIDYLLGRTDVKKPDITIQAICEYTGLSEEAATKLKSINDHFNFLQHKGCSFPLDMRVIFNFFVLNNTFWDGIQSASELQAIKQGITPTQKDARIKTASGYIPIPEKKYCGFLQHNAVSLLAAAMCEYIATFSPDTVRIGEPVDIDHIV